MARTIGNPLSWIAQRMAGTATHLAHVTEEINTSDAAPPKINQITTADLRDALRKGYDDFIAMRTDVMFIVVLYPILGACLVALAFQGDLLHLLFPVLSGFALVGPFAAVGLYEMSRRREKGEPAGWSAAVDVLRSPRFGALFMLGLFHVGLFVVWLMIANLIYAATLGPDAPASMGAFLNQVLTTPAGWTLIIFGMGAGFAFAVAVLACSVVSFPLLLDRNVGLPLAIITSVRVARANPVPIAMWGLIVAVLLALGALPFLLGLILVLPILGHATWHLYRKAVG